MYWQCMGSPYIVQPSIECIPAADMWYAEKGPFESSPRQDMQQKHWRHRSLHADWYRQSSYQPITDQAGGAEITNRCWHECNALETHDECADVSNAPQALDKL